MSLFVNAPPERASNRAPDKLRAKTAVAVPRGPITRRQHSLANKREENEKRSLLLKLNDDLLEKVLSFLPGRELAAIETVCTHFRYGGWLAANKPPDARGLGETQARCARARRDAPRLQVRCSRFPLSVTKTSRAVLDARRVFPPPTARGPSGAAPRAADAPYTARLVAARGSRATRAARSGRVACRLFRDDVRPRRGVSRGPSSRRVIDPPIRPHHARHRKHVRRRAGR